MKSFVLSDDPIPASLPPFDPGDGAEVQFLGAVRAIEMDRRISGINYSAYWAMAERLLKGLLDRGEAEHGEHSVFIQHRLGFVQAREPSILIRVRTRHSAEAFKICQWYLEEIKTSIPIWKDPVWEE